jgi:hypothetical protein
MIPWSPCHTCCSWRQAHQGHGSLWDFVAEKDHLPLQVISRHVTSTHDRPSAGWWSYRRWGEDELLAGQYTTLTDEISRGGWFASWGRLEGDGVGWLC